MHHCPGKPRPVEVVEVVLGLSTSAVHEAAVRVMVVAVLFVLSAVVMYDEMYLVMHDEMYLHAILR